MADAERRRRRVRQAPGPARENGAAGQSTVTSGVHDSATGTGPARRGGPGGGGTGGGEERDGGERGLRGLVGSGSSQVGIRAAMRARDAARPSEQELAEAESRVTIVRRNWVPREELPRPPR